MPKWLDDKIAYLRKSRQDDPNETVEEVLEKHETLLQEYCMREFGGLIPPDNIYREVVSGESIDARVEVQKILARIEDPAIKGVVVVEPSRLSRGDLGDCARLMSALRFSRTLVHTPMMTYDLEKKIERKFFQDELLRGNDFLEYTKEILFRGRVAAVKRGCFIGSKAPYGYKKIQIGKDHTLEIVEDEAEVVRQIFDWYTAEHLKPYDIACRLNKMGVRPRRAAEWKKDTIRKMVRNIHYAGYVGFNQVKTTQVMENGELRTVKVSQPEEEWIIAEGKHDAIVSRDVWKLTQERVAEHPRNKHTHPLNNPYSGVLRCAKCGRALRLHPYKNAEDRYQCKLRPPCVKSIRASVVHDAIVYALEHSELPALELRVKNGDGDARKIQQRQLEKLEKQMEEYRAQEEKQFELLETGRYTDEVFDKRNAALRIKMDECQAELYKVKSSMPASVDYAERVATLQDVIAMLKSDAATAEQKNKALKVIVEKIEYSGPPSDKQNRKRAAKNECSPFEIKIFLRL